MEIKITVTVGSCDPIEVKINVPSEGETKKVERIHMDENPYMVWFDDTCVGWTKSAELNKVFLLTQQRYANDLLVSRGYLTLNEVYDLIGILRTKAGQTVGWIYNKENPIGDNCIDFGIYIEHNREFCNGLTANALLDFNVDGDIMKYL